MFFLGAILCLGFSSAFHTVHCHSPQVIPGPLLTVSVTVSEAAGGEALFQAGLLRHLLHDRGLLRPLALLLLLLRGRVQSRPFSQSDRAQSQMWAFEYAYMALIAVLGAGGVVVSMWDKFSEPAFRGIRAGVFIGEAPSQLATGDT